MKVFHFCHALIICVAFTFTNADAGDLTPRAEVNFRAGTDRSILMTEFWAPLAQQSDRVLYGDLRLMGDGDDNREGNLGFGYRQISTKTNSVLGGNVWIDRRRTENGNNFHQLTLGLESLGDVIDLRANGYIQLNNSKTRVTPNIGSVTPYLAGTGIFFDTNGFIIEEPQNGFDAEIGYRLPVLQKYIDATRAYTGGYHFWGDTTDNVTGLRLRAEAQVNSIFSVGARFQYDEPRGSQGFLEATLRFPFKSKKLYQEHGLRSRLDESPERDIDIVTSAKVDTGLMKPVVNVATGTQQRILYVDNTNINTGDGSKENPFNTLASAQAALQENDILYINRGNGTTAGMDQGIVVDKANVQLIGSGSALYYNGYSLLSAGIAPTITNIQTRVDDYTGNGIFVTADNALVSGVTVTGAKGHGIAMRAENAVWNSAIVTNSTAIANTWYGVRIIATNTGHIENVVVSDNVLSNSITRGGAIVSGETGSIGTVIIQNNNAFSNATHGLFVQSSAAGQINTLILNKNNTNLNIQSGIFGTVSSTGSAIETISADQNNTLENGSNGIFLQAVSNARIGNIAIDRHIGNRNAHTGMYIQISSASVLNNLKITNSISNDNTGPNGYGLWVHVNGTNSTLMKADISDNITNNNSKTGTLLHTGGGIINEARIDRNTSNANRDYGFYIYSQTATSVLKNTALSYNNSVGNIVHGLYARQSDPSAVLLVDLGGGAFGSTGQNRIFGSGGSDLHVERAAVSAANNWWNNGGSAPTRVALTNGGSATYMPPLATDPRP